jgi:hypothetical protein
MSSFGREERVQESGVVGHSFDSDDRIEDLDIYEALVNPHHAGGGTQKGGAGGPGMMPMGGGAGGWSGKAGTTAGGTTEGSAGAGRGTAAAGAGTGASGVGAPGFAGSGAGGVSGLGGGGSGGLGGVGAGGLSGSGPGSAASNFSMPTLGTSAAGVTDPSTTGFDVPPVTGTAPGGDTLPSPGTYPGAGGLSNVPGSGPSWTPPTTSNPSTGSAPPSIPSVGGGGMPSVGGAGSGPGGAGGAPSSGGLGVAPVQASPEMLHKEAQHWDDMAMELTAAVVNPVNALAPLSVDFGMMVDAFAAYSDLVNRMKSWSSQAGAEFAGISDALQSASGDYKDTEATNASESRTILTGSPTVAV